MPLGRSLRGLRRALVPTTQGHLRPQLAVAREHSMEPGQVDSRRRHQRRQSCHEVHGRFESVLGAIDTSMSVRRRLRHTENSANFAGFTPRQPNTVRIMQAWTNHLDKLSSNTTVIVTGLTGQSGQSWRKCSLHKKGLSAAITQNIYRRRR